MLSGIHEGEKTMKIKRSSLKVVSGGQTGVDQLGLKIAKRLGIPTGGYINYGCVTEAGKQPELIEMYGLQEIKPQRSLAEDYVTRTKCNVISSDCTLIYGNTESRGSKCAIMFCKRHNKPYSLNPTKESIERGLDRGYRIFNIAGNRMSTLDTQTYFDIDWAITDAFEQLTKL